MLSVVMSVIASVIPSATFVPVEGPVISTFKEPACQWCSGRRGIVLDSYPGEPVVSVAAGIVSFSDVVAGVRYVTVQTGDGWKITYGRVMRPTLDQGDWVVAGQVVATASDNLFLSLRMGAKAFDPVLMFRRNRVILLP